MAKNRNQKKGTVRSSQKPKNPLVEKVIFAKDSEPIRKNNKIGNWFQILRRFAWLLITIFSTVGGLSAWFAFVPKLDVKFENTFDSKDPFKSVVEIRNSGLLPVKSIKYSCFFEAIKSDSGATAETIEFNLGLEDIPEITSGEAYSENFPIVVQPPINWTGLANSFAIVFSETSPISDFR